MRSMALMMTGCMLFACGVGSADTVELSGGGHLDGAVQQRGDAVIVALDDEIQVAVPASRVRRVVTRDQLAAYRQRVINAAEDPEEHYKLAIWCVSDNNIPGNAQMYKRYHMSRAIELDPDHTKARAGLGYTRSEGQWILTSELMRQRGMITRGGSWELPESLAIEDFRDANDVATKKWIREVKRLVGVVSSGKNNSKTQEAWERLKGINDPQAAGAIAKQLEDARKKGNRDLKMLWVDLLGRFQNMTAVEALVKTGLEETDEVVRERALGHLTKFGASSAVATYLPLLTKNDNDLVNRAARGLSWFPDPELALNYVNALVTTHKQQIAPGPGMQVGFGSDGGGGMSTGGQAKIISETKTNPAVLALVRAIEPEADYGYDEQKWLLHFARKRGTFTGDLRRDAR
ncbi:MAG: HEAT repeat domain-containing protein [Planctomycetota bacterium]